MGTSLQELDWMGWSSSPYNIRPFTHTDRTRRTYHRRQRIPINLVFTLPKIIDLVSNLFPSGTVVQSLIIPGLSFFNAIPSAHLHILARSNPPKLAIWFSSILSLCYITSAVVYLAAGCLGNYNPNRPSNNFQRNDCPSGSTTVTWDVNVALQLLSFVCYTMHAAMAVKVHRFHKKRTQAIEGGTLVEEIDLQAKARREQEARERWQRIVDL